MIRTYLTLLILTIFQCESFSQFFFPVKDSSRINKLTCPFVNRPLTLYKNQLQAATVWEYNILYNKYNENKEIVNLAQAGETSFRQDFNLNLAYGITDYLLAGIELGYINAVDKNMEKLYIDPSPFFYYKHKLNIKTQTKGMKDVTLNLRYLLPFKSKLFSLAIECGTVIPVGNNKISKPDTTNSVSQNIIIFTYEHDMTKYNFPSYSSLCGNFKIIGKIGRNKLATFFTFQYTRGLAEKQINDWSSDVDFISINKYDMFTGKMITYKKLQGFNVNKTSYAYSYGNYYKTNAYLAWQIKPYFVTKFGVDGFLHSGSYKKNRSDREYQPDEFNLMAFASYELQVTPRLRFQQSVASTFYGMNTKIPVIIYTSIVFNAFL